MRKRNARLKSSQDSGHSRLEPVPRRCRKRVRPPDIAKTFVKKRIDQNGFLVKYINNFIGRGVFADREFEQGEFLLEYSGKLLSGDAARGMIDTDYTYHFEFKGESKCIDATKEPSDGPSLCRLVNHGNHKRDRNANMKYVEVEGIPHLCLFSTRRILQGEEILYDYGVKNLPWQKQKQDLHVDPDNQISFSDSQASDVPTQLSSKASTTAVVKDLHADPDNQIRFSDSQASGDPTQLSSNAATTAVVMDLHVDGENQISFSDSQASDDPTQLSTKASTTAVVMELHADPDNQISFSDSQASADPTQLSSNAAATAVVMDLHVDAENQISFSDRQASDDPTQLFSKASTTEVVMDLHADPDNQISFSDSQASGDPTQLSSNAATTAVVMDLHVDPDNQISFPDSQASDDPTQLSTKASTTAVVMDLHADPDNQISFSDSQASGDPTQLSSNAATTAVVMDLHVNPDNQISFPDSQASDDPTQLSTKASTTAVVMDLHVDAENQISFSDSQASDDPTQLSTKASTTAVVMDLHADPDNQISFSDSQASDDPTQLSSNASATAVVMDLHADPDKQISFSDSQASDDPTQLFSKASTTAVVMDLQADPDNQISFSDIQASDDPTQLSSNASAAAVVMMRSTQRPHRKKQRTAKLDWHAVSDDDMGVSDDSFNDPPYIPPNGYDSMSDDETDSQTKSTKISSSLKLKVKQRERQKKPCAGKDVVENSESDHSEASETYPILTNICQQVWRTENKDLSDDNAAAYANDVEQEDLSDAYDKQEDLSDDNDEKEDLSEDDKNDESDGVTIEGTTSYIDGRRKVDKKQCCVFCGIYDYRLPRHYERHHNDHPTIRALQTKTENERDRELDRLRLEGAYKHNIKVLSENKGRLILQRRPSKDDESKYTYEDYLHCEYCKGSFLKNNLWRHQKKCQFKPSEKNDGSKGKRRRPQRNSVLLMETVLQKNKAFKPGFIKNVISTLHVDEVSNIIKKDDVIMRVGDFMYDKHAKSQREYISQELRLLGRLVVSLRDEFKSPKGYLKDFLCPKNFDGIVESARNLSMKEETEDSLVLRKYSVALKCGPSLNKCCVILKGIARRSSDEKREKEAQRLQDLITDEWSGKVTSVALRSRKEIKRNSVILLPTPSDLSRLKNHIDSEISTAYENLKDNNESSEGFQKLQAAILCRIIMFNRRRSGETSKILLKDYLMRPDWRQSINEEIYQSLGSIEKQLIKRLDMIALRGKKGRSVTIIVTPEIKAGLELLVRCRPYNIDIDNPFLFARGSGLNNIRGSDHMTKFANQAGLEFPERIGATNMRKYIATVVQVLNLNEAELEWLSNHLGHTTAVHKEYYRNQGAAIQLGKVAKTLIAMDQGQTLSSLQQEDLPDDIVTEGLSDDEGYDMLNDEMTEVQDEVSEIHATEAGTVMRKKGPTIKPWSKEEISAIKRHLQGHINIMKCPGKKACEEAINKQPALKNRDWRSVKYKVAYLISKKKERQNKPKEKTKCKSKK